MTFQTILDISCYTRKISHVVIVSHPACATPRATSPFDCGLCMASQILPLGMFNLVLVTSQLKQDLSIELIDRCIGSRIWVVMKNDREFTGTLLGFDDFVS